MVFIGIGHHYHRGFHYYNQHPWHFWPRFGPQRHHRRTGERPFKLVLFQRSRPPVVAPPPPTAVVANTGETTHVGQPAVATVTQETPMIVAVPASQSGYPSQPAEPGFPAQQPGYQPPVYPPANTETPYPPISTAPQPDQNPPVSGSFGSYPPAKPVQDDASGQPASTDPAQQANNKWRSVHVTAVLYNNFNN